MSAATKVPPSPALRVEAAAKASQPPETVGSHLGTAGDGRSPVEGRPDETRGKWAGQCLIAVPPADLYLAHRAAFLARGK